MGITGLLPFLKNSCRNASVKDFSGATVAIDAYSWLHKGAFSCAEKLVKGEKTDGYVLYCMKLINMFLDCGVKPIMVFDGCRLPSKEGTEKKRRENREKTRQKGKEFLCQGKLKEARECFQRCVDVTPEMAREVIEACRKKSIDCIVAPYEADAQLAYLNKIGMVQIIITEDSDLILFGCEKILFKMDSCGGGMLYEKKDLPKSLGAVAERFSFDKFRYMCILSGCDYLPSLPGIGLAKACKFFSLTNNPDLLNILRKIPSYLQNPKLVVSTEYRESFIKANNTFLYQLVFCPKKKYLVPLNPYPEGMDPTQLEYAGKYLPDDLACQLAIGNVNVNTLKKFNKFECDKNFDFLDDDFDKMWSEIEKQESKIKTNLSAFKHSDKIANVNTSTQKKRNFDEIQTESIQHEDDLFSTYKELSPEAKHQKLGEPDKWKPGQELQDESKVVHVGSLLPFAKQSEASPHLNKSTSTFALKKVVRSRFFANQIQVDPKKSAPVKSSVLETIDNELQELTATLSRKRKFTRILSPLNSKVDLEAKVSDNKAPKPEDPVLPKINGKENFVHGLTKKMQIELMLDRSFDQSLTGCTATKSLRDDKNKSSAVPLDETWGGGNSSVLEDVRDDSILRWTEEGVLPPKAFDKESICHRFAKKKVLGSKASLVSTLEFTTRESKKDMIVDYVDDDLPEFEAVKDTSSSRNENRLSKVIDAKVYDSPTELCKESIAHMFYKKKTNNFQWTGGKSSLADQPEFELVLNARSGDHQKSEHSADQTSNLSNSKVKSLRSTNVKNRKQKIEFSLTMSDDEIQVERVESLSRKAYEQVLKFDIGDDDIFNANKADSSNTKVEQDASDSLASDTEKRSPINEALRNSDKRCDSLPETEKRNCKRLSLQRKLCISSSLGSDGNFLHDSLETSEDSGIAMPIRKTSMFFKPLSSNCETIPTNSFSTSEDVVLISSDSEDASFGNSKSKTNENVSASPKDIFNKAFKASRNSSSKANKCRSIGLLKKRLSSQKVDRKETLYNFNFARQPKSEVAVL